MTPSVRRVRGTDDISDVARLFVDERLRSVPVLEAARLTGIVSRRDLLRMLVRPDDEIRAEVLRLVESYTGELACGTSESSRGQCPSTASAANRRSRQTWRSTH